MNVIRTQSDHASDKGSWRLTGRRKRTVLTVLTIVSLGVVSLLYSARVLSRAPERPISPERKGTMLPTTQTSGDKHAVPPIDVSAHLHTETATFALG